jgi:hypothetical protein
VDYALIREVEPQEAEALLTLRLFIPDVAEGCEDRHYLSRRRPRYCSVVESVTVNPDGSVTERGTLTSNESVVVAHSCFADGRTRDGRGCGFGKTVSIVGQSADAVVVQVSMYWTDREGKKGSLDEELIVPWLGTGKRELGGGAWMVAEIMPAGSSAEPRATPDCGGS